MAVELYPHNQKTYQKMLSMFKNRNRVGIVQPTGTGKSFLYLKWIEDHPQDHFVVLSPSTEIFTQLQEYAESSGTPDLLSSAEMISYQTLLKMSDEEVEAICPDKMVLDEFHRAGAELWGPSLLRLLNANPTAQILGASATPVRYLDDCKDMSMELFDRNLAAEITLGEAVRRKILPMPKYVPVWYDIDGKLEQYDRDVSRIEDKNERKDLEEQLERLKRRLENAYGAEDIFRKYMPNDHGKYIVFCRNKEHLEEMKNAMRSWLSGVNKNIRSYVSISAQEDKDLQLQAFKEDHVDDAIKLLFTVDRLNEGVHVKGIDGVIMLRPTISPIIYLQQMGRALAVGHDHPLIFDIVNNYLSVQVPLGNGESRNVFWHEFRNHADGSKDVEEFHMFDDMMEFSSLFESLESNLYFTYDQRWEETRSKVEKYYLETGRFPSRNAKSDIEQKLGIWCNNQKTMAKKGKLSQERIEKLKKMGLLDDTHDARWDQIYDEVVEFKTNNGRFPSQKAKSDIERKLGIWCATQKIAAKKGKLSQERIEKLKKMGLLDDTHDARWDQFYDEVVEFKTNNGRFPSTKAKSDIERKLGQWCNAQKQMAKKGTLPEDRYLKLKKMGLLDDTPDARWEENCAKVERFVLENGRFPSQTAEGDIGKLGRWCNAQKQMAKKGTLPEDRYLKLKKMGLLDDTQDAKWEETRAKVEKYYLETGRFPSQRAKSDIERKLGQWCRLQKSMAKKSKLPEDRYQKLKNMGLLDSTQDAKWEETRAKVEKYYLETGRFPSSEAKGDAGKLGRWCSTQKTAAKKGKLSQERFEKLKKMGLLK